MLIEMQKVGKIYGGFGGGYQALKDVDLRIDAGEMVAIRGRSGAGKSTLMHVIGCVDTFEEGRYLLDGMDVGRMKDKELSAVRNKKIGFVMQDFALIRQLSVYDNVAIPLYLSKERNLGKATKLVKEAAQAVGLGGMLDKKVNQLSGGQKQRVAIARAIVNSPQIILADEPTGALDVKTASEILALLKELNQRGITVVIISHDDQVVSSCDRILRIEDGKLYFEKEGKV